MLDLKITTLIIEKDKDELDKTLEVLSGFSEFSIVAKATSGKQGMALVNNYVPQLIFINIELSDTNGLELLRNMRNRNLSGNIVFMANDSSSAFESLPLEPFDFLLKPIDADLVERLIIRLKQKMQTNELLRKMDAYTKMQAVDEKRIFHQKKGIVVLRLEEILFCKAELISTSLKLRTGEELIVKSKITDTIEIINHKDFIRTGRSYFINRTYLRKIDKKKLKCILYFEGKTWEVPVSKNTIRVFEKLNVQPIY